MKVTRSLLVRSHQRRLTNWLLQKWTESHKTSFVLCEREKLLICQVCIISYVTLPGFAICFTNKSVEIMDMLVFAEQVEKEGL